MPPLSCKYLAKGRRLCTCCSILTVHRAEVASLVRKNEKTTSYVLHPRHCFISKVFADNIYDIIHTYTGVFSLGQYVFASGPSHVVGSACSRPARGPTRSPPVRRRTCCCRCWCAAAAAVLQQHPLGLDGHWNGSARRLRTLATGCGQSTKESACR